MLSFNTVHNLRILSAGTKRYQPQGESDTNYEYIRDESIAPVPAALKPKVTTRKITAQDVSNRMHLYDLDETELYHELGPSTVDGEASGTAEPGASGHNYVNTSQDIYHYAMVETTNTTLSQLAIVESDRPNRGTSLMSQVEGREVRNIVWNNNNFNYKRL